jgi:hypothetical protein
VTPHSIVRSLLLLGWKVTAASKGAADVTTIGAERTDTTVVEVILGVDTHLDFHVAVTIDHLGRRLGESSVPTTAKGYERLLCWAEGFGPLRCAGIEGASSYGAGFARHLRARGIEVLEVERPKRGQRSSRRNVKSDSSDPSPESTPRPGSEPSFPRLCGHLRGSGRTRFQGRQAPCPPPPWSPARCLPRPFSSPC